MCLINNVGKYSKINYVIMGGGGGRGRSREKMTNYDKGRGVKHNKKKKMTLFVNGS